MAKSKPASSPQLDASDRQFLVEAAKAGIESARAVLSAEAERLGVEAGLVTKNASPDAPLVPTPTAS